MPQSGAVIDVAAYLLILPTVFPGIAAARKKRGVRAGLVYAAVTSLALFFVHALRGDLARRRLPGGCGVCFCFNMVEAALEKLLPTMSNGSEALDMHKLIAAVVEECTARLSERKKPASTPLPEGKDMKGFLTYIFEEVRLPHAASCATRHLTHIIHAHRAYKR